MAPPPPPPMMTSVTLDPIGVFETGVFDDSAAEIVAFDAALNQLFVVNSGATTVDVLDLSDPTNPTLVGQIDATVFGGAANSIAVFDDNLAVAIEANDPQMPGRVALFDTNTLLNTRFVQVGALPDMVTFTPDGSKILVANEGEPNDDYSIDPEGSISIIEVDGTPADAITVSFASLNGMEDTLNAEGVRIFGPGASVAQDLEPEFIVVSSDSSTAYVTAQENNALITIDIESATVTDITSFGTVDHSQAGNELDASNRDGGINIQNWPVFGMRMPDGIDIFEVNGESFIITANEGDGREFDTFEEVERVEDLLLDLTAFPNAADLQLEENLGRLEVSNVMGDTDGDGDFDQLFSFGGRSFAIFDMEGNLVFDSGSDFEMITADVFPDDFNSTNDENDSFDNRSDDAGPEPEGVIVGEIDGELFAFIGLERIGGIMVYNVTDPTAPTFVSYLNNRDFSVTDVTTSAVGDLGPEGLAFIPADESPNGAPLLAVGNEVSGTTTLFQLDTAQVPVP